MRFVEFFYKKGKLLISYFGGDLEKCLRTSERDQTYFLIVHLAEIPGVCTYIHCTKSRPRYDDGIALRQTVTTELYCARRRAKCGIHGINIHSRAAPASPLELMTPFKKKRMWYSPHVE